MMDCIKIFDQDETKFAKGAVLEAKRNKGKVNDLLLEHLNKFSENLEKYKGKECPISIIYSIYLLAEFEDKRLFPVLVKIFENKKCEPENIIGLCVTDRLHSIIVSVFDGNFKALNNIIEDKKINEFIRCQFLKCYIYFYDNKMINSKELEEYLLKLIKLYNYKVDSIYDEILEVIINTHLFTMMENVKEMFHYGVIDTMIRGAYDDFIDYIFDYEDTLDKFTKIEDTIKEMSWWSCFKINDNKNDDEKFSEALNKIVEHDLKRLNNISTNKVGRNDPCPCGSGKKYKKCCIDKKDIIVLPYNSFIEDSWRRYPKKKDNEEKYDLYDFYKEEYIEIDKLLYKAMKHRIIPIFITRDYNTENKIDLEYYKEAFEKIKAVQKKEKFKTLDEYDKKVSIHYSIYDFYNRYTKLLDVVLEKHYCSNKNILLNDLEELTDFFYDNFDLNNVNEVIFLNSKFILYNLKDKLDDGIKFFEDKLKKCLPELKYDIYDFLFDLYMCKYDDITKLEDMIDKEDDEELKQSLEELKLDYMDF